MKAKWFTITSDLKQLHKQYIKLAKQYHPDIGGSEEIMKEINLEYERLRNNPEDYTTAKKTYSRKTNTKSYHTKYKKEPEDLTLDELLQVAKIRNYKIGWVAINALKLAKSYEDCLKIARACNYKDGWAYYQWEKIKQSA